MTQKHGDARWLKETDSWNFWNCNSMQVRFGIWREVICNPENRWNTHPIAITKRSGDLPGKTA